MLKLKGQIHIGRYHGTDTVSIEVTDESSRCRAMHIELNAAAFASALFSSMVDCEIEFNDSCVIGSQAETKAELVPFNAFSVRSRKDHESDNYRTPAAIKALAPFEVDGWRGRARDLFNGHNNVKDKDGNKQRVIFDRWMRDGKPVELKASR